MPPMFVIATALLALMAVLATLQYRWLGRISDAERERMTATLNARAAAVAEDFDRELTLAYMLFQFEPLLADPNAPVESLPVRLSARYDRWQASARYPRLISGWYVASRQDDGSTGLQKFNTATRATEKVEWPDALMPIRLHLDDVKEEKSGSGTIVVRTIAPALWERIPALVVPSAPTPLVFLNQASARTAGAHPSPASSLAYTLLVLDRQYIAGELLPSLIAQHFQPDAENTRYQLAIVDARDSAPVYRSAAGFAPAADAKVDAAADLFQVRPQEFPQIAADVRRFIALAPPPGSAVGAETVTTIMVPLGRAPAAGERRGGDPEKPAAAHGLAGRETRSPVVARQGPTVRGRTYLTSVSSASARAAMAAKWRLLVKHPAGSLEAAVGSVRRRNLLISTSILALLAASMAMIVVSTRRSQELARQQMEFVAAVSHELRTPLAVVRAAGDNLAEGVIQDEEQVRTYGALVRNEGRRLTEMVEQILEFAGIHSGQRTFTATAVRPDLLIAAVLRASDTLIDAAGLTVDVNIPADLPPVAGDEAALRRVFQNLVGNAIKYGADGRWIGISASRAGSEVRISVSDRGIGIAPADQGRIFEPFYRTADVVAAQVQGAGLGLSLVHRIVTAHGGRIAVKSARSMGSEFIVHLPVATGQLAAPTGATPGSGTDVHAATATAKPS